jgi:hypothetical protein
MSGGYGVIVIGARSAVSSNAFAEGGLRVALVEHANRYVPAAPPQRCGTWLRLMRRVPSRSILYSSGRPEPERI